MEPDEFKSLVIESKKAWLSLGSIKYGGTKDEEKSKAFRRSIYTTEDIQEGELFTTNNIRIIRPGHGAPPSFYEQVLGSKAKRFFPRGTPLKIKDCL